VDDQGNIRDILPIKIPWIEKSWVRNQNDERILLHIKDLIDAPHISNLTSEEEEAHLTNSRDKIVRYVLYCLHD
jgi:hypothetical protein